MRYLIAGNGPAAVNAVRAIRSLGDTGEIVMVSPEDNEPYSRITVPEYMAGEIDEGGMLFAPGFYSEYGVRTKLARSVVKLFPDKHIAVLSSGEEIVYDKLLLATGARPYVPDWADMSLRGMFTLWNKSDAEAVKPCMEPGANAVIAGAGLVAFQAARALSSFGMKVTLVARRFIMSRQLDAHAAEMLRAAAEEHGVRILLHTSVTRLLSDGGAVTGVELSNGETIASRCVLACMGTKPNLGMLDGLLEYDGGVDVDDHMHTALPDVYAAGDIVRARMASGGRAVRAIWPNAVAQGRIAGLNMAGHPELWDGSRAMNSIELFGLSFISAGETEPAEGEREIMLSCKERDYRKIITDGTGTVRGVTFAGAVREAGIFAAKVGMSASGGFMGSLPELSPELIRE